MKTITEIAETLFIDMINGNYKLSMNDVEEISLTAFQYASMFQKKSHEFVDETKPVVYRLKGCRACHGSGGKRSDPCKVCGGTGKVQDK